MSRAFLTPDWTDGAKGAMAVLSTLRVKVENLEGEEKELIPVGDVGLSAIVVIPMAVGRRESEVAKSGRSPIAYKMNQFNSVEWNRGPAEMWSMRQFLRPWRAIILLVRSIRLIRLVVYLMMR